MLSIACNVLLIVLGFLFECIADLFRRRTEKTTSPQERLMTIAPTPAGFVRFRGTKELLAKPMTRGEYNDYRDWTPPQGEDQAAAGYLVEYVEGGKPNDSRHAGYISWSPADVFEKAYHPVVETTFADRMRVELSELNDKLSRLQIFIGTERFNQLPFEEREDQRNQLRAMTLYSGVLTKRLARATS